MEGENTVPMVDREYEARRALTRDVSERQAQVRDDPGFIDTVAKYAAIGAAGYLIGRKVVKSDAVIEALHHIGQFGRRVMEPVAGVMRGMMDEFAGVAGRETAAVGRFDLMEHLSESVRLSDQLYASGHTTAHVLELMKTVREGVRAQGFDNLERAGLSRFRPATVEDLYRQGSGEALQKAIGQQGFETISKAHELGMIGKQTALTRGNLGLMIDPVAPGAFVDTRWASPRHLAGGAANLINQIKIPILGLRPGDMILALMRPFGQGHFAGMVGRNLEVQEGIRTGPYANAVIGGKLMSHTEKGWVQLADNIRLGKMGRVGQASLERMGNAERYVGQELKRRVTQNRGGWRGLKDLAQYATGMGPEYRTRDSVLKTGVWDPLMGREKGQVLRHEYVPRGVNQTFAQRLMTTIEAQAAGRDPHRALTEAVLNDRELTRTDRFLAHFGMSKRASLIKRGRVPSAASPITPADMLATGPEYMGNLAGRRIAVPGTDYVKPGALGSAPAQTVPMEYYAYAGKGRGAGNNLGTWIKGQAYAALDVGHYMTNRLNDLFGMTIGVGFRPSVGKGLTTGALALGKNVAKIYGIYQGVQAGAEYVNYADYVAEMALKPILTLGGAVDHPYTSPKKLLIGAYQAARIGQTAVRQGLGITKAANYLEDLMPGSMSTMLSDLVRTVGPVLAGASKSGVVGARFGLAVAGLIGGSDPGKSLSDVTAEFSGDKDVPVRKGSHWVLGRQPWEGGQIDHFEPHWTRIALSDYKYSDVRYGSKDEYWTSVSRIPTPHNLFGLVPLLQEGGPMGGGDLYLAKKHQYDRPYPNTPGVDTAQAVEDATYSAARGPYDPPAGAGQRLGLGSAGTMPEAPTSKDGMLGGIAKFGNELGELTGMYKFLLWDLPGFSKEQAPHIGSYSEINSQAHDFWDANVGGMLGMSELYRRFNPPEEGKPGVNTVPNTMPVWLPGSRSDIKEDRTYGTDFTSGDPYTKVQSGERRLPGAAYEILHVLHSGSPGVYDPMDRFLVLADVAPSSASFKHYQTIVESWDKAGVLDASWKEKFQTTKRQVKDKMERYAFFDRKFTGTITAPNAEKLNEKYNLIERAVGGAYEVFAHDIVPKVTDPIPVLGSIVSDKLFPVRSPLEHYERFQVYGEEFGDWRSPWRQLIRPKLHQLTAQDPLTASAGGAMFAMFGANPIAAFTLGAAGMLGLGGASAMRAVNTGEMTGGYVPDFRQKEHELQEYFDKLQYAKSEMLEQRSEAVGDKELSDYYKKQMGRTVAGLSFGTKDQHTYVMQSMRALPRNERAYLLPFMQMPEAAQDKMAKYMSPDLAPVFLRAAGRQGDAVFAPYKKLLTQSSDERVGAFFRENGGLPDSSWGGWHPDVPMDTIKIKMVDAGAGSTSSDIHKFDLFAEHRYRASKFANLQTAPISRTLKHVMPNDGVGASLFQELDDAGFQNIRLRHTAGGSSDGGEDVNWNVRRVLPDMVGAVERFLR